MRPKPSGHATPAATGSAAGEKIAAREMVFATRSVAGTIAAGRKIAALLKRGDFVALNGPLGAGKTVLTRGIAVGLGLADERLVNSPTFVLVQEYPAATPVFHIDLYRLCQPGGELEELGLREMLDQGVVIVEWAGRAQDTLPANRWEVDIEITSERGRKIQARKLDAI